MKHIFLFNAKAGNSNLLLISNLESICYSLGLDFLIIRSDTKEEAKEWIHHYKGEDAIIYAVGGDGTLNFVLNELVGGKASLGIIPVGSGNDFYRKLNESSKAIINANVMKINDTYGLNIFSVGMDAEICYYAEEFKKLHFPPSMIYNAALFYTLFKHQNRGIGINGFFERLMLVAICNGTFYGGGYAIAPHANLETNGTLVYTVGDMSKIKMPLFLLQLARGVHEDNSYVDIYEAKDTIVIEGGRPLIGQIDGEIMNEHIYQVEPHATSINVVNNRELILELKKKKLISLK